MIIINYPYDTDENIKINNNNYNIYNNSKCRRN